MKNPKVVVYNSDSRFIVDIAVYRHVTTPDEISVHIQSIHPVPPSEPKTPDDPVRKLVHPRIKETFEAQLYPTEVVPHKK